jgi:pantoate--beta-alanine ligase
MITVSYAKVMSTLARQAHAAGKRIGFVPTMGALHESHLSLVRAARQQSDVVVCSIFVNPTQFGPTEDLSQYPRNFERDRDMLAGEKTDYIFYPSVDEMYPPGATTWVHVEGLSEKLDGKSRPGHFRGVSTVVSKLFHLVQPDKAYFGQKDAAQVAVIRKMVHDLNFDLEIVVCPIVREPDGLAMSSRNAYLDPTQRKQALALSRSLKQIQVMIERGELKADALIRAGKQTIAAESGARLDYFEIVDPDTLDPQEGVSKGALVAVAAYVGSTRLIDNLLVTPR